MDPDCHDGLVVKAKNKSKASVPKYLDVDIREADLPQTCRGIRLRTALYSVPIHSDLPRGILVDHPAIAVGKEHKTAQEHIPTINFKGVSKETLKEYGINVVGSPERVIIVTTSPVAIGLRDSRISHADVVKQGNNLEVRVYALPDRQDGSQRVKLVICNKNQMPDVSEPERRANLPISGPQNLVNELNKRGMEYDKERGSMRFVKSQPIPRQPVELVFSPSTRSIAVSKAAAGDGIVIAVDHMPYNKGTFVRVEVSVHKDGKVDVGNPRTP